MNPRIKALWLAELRDESNRQGRGHLRRMVGPGWTNYCCLGLLCEIAVREGVIDPPTFREHTGVYDYCSNHSQLLPEDVWHWAELDTINPVVTVLEPGFTTSTKTLSGLNDSGYTFGQIADLIEAQL